MLKSTAAAKINSTTPDVVLLDSSDLKSLNPWIEQTLNTISEKASFNAGTALLMSQGMYMTDPELIRQHDAPQHLTAVGPGSEVYGRIWPNGLDVRSLYVEKHNYENEGSPPLSPADLGVLVLDQIHLTQVQRNQIVSSGKLSVYGNYKIYANKSFMIMNSTYTESTKACLNEDDQYKEAVRDGDLVKAFHRIRFVCYKGKTSVADTITKLTEVITNPILHKIHLKPGEQVENYIKRFKENLDMANQTRLSDGQGRITLEETIHGLKLGLDERFIFVKQYWNSSPPASLEAAYAFIREHARKGETDAAKEKSARRALELEAQEETGEGQPKRIRPDLDQPPSSKGRFNGARNRYYNNNRQTVLFTGDDEYDDDFADDFADDHYQQNSIPVFNTRSQSPSMRNRSGLSGRIAGGYDDSVMSSLQMQQQQISVLLAEMEKSRGKGDGNRKARCNNELMYPEIGCRYPNCRFQHLMNYSGESASGGGASGNQGGGMPNVRSSGNGVAGANNVPNAPVIRNPFAPASNKPN